MTPPASRKPGNQAGRYAHLFGCCREVGPLTDSLIATAPMAALASADPVMGDVDR